MTESIRVGNADRDKIADAVRDWYASGHLEDDEMQARIEQALAAKTQGELDRVLKDLPVPVAEATRIRTSSVPGGILFATSAVLGIALPVYLLNAVSKGHGVSVLGKFEVAAAIALGIAGIITAIVSWAFAGDQRDRDFKLKQDKQRRE